MRERYVDLVRSFPQVRQVLLEETPSGPRIWTVIEAEPFDRDQREPLYAAELEATGAAPEIDIDFRVVNVVEHGSSRFGLSFLPTDILPRPSTSVEPSRC